MNEKIILFLLVFGVGVFKVARLFLHDRNFDLLIFYIQDDPNDPTAVGFNFVNKIVNEDNGN